MTQVQRVMSRTFVVAHGRDLARDTERRLAGGHYFAVVEDEVVLGILCGCDLRGAEGEASVEDFIRLPVLGIGQDAPVREAATLMQGRGIGCLAVFSDRRRLVGLLTRADLRGAGVAPGLFTTPVCQACGSDEHVRARGHREGVGFCPSCLDRAMPSDAETGGEG